MEVKLTKEQARILARDLQLGEILSMQYDLDEAERNQGLIKALRTIHAIAGWPSREEA